MTISVWPSGWACHAVRAPGSKVTLAPVLYSLAMHSGAFSQVAHELKIMQSEFAAKLDVEQLAGMAHMSTSAFHRAFKEITSKSPMQYLKKVRLTKAKNFMVQESMKASRSSAGNSNAILGRALQK